MKAYSLFGPQKAALPAPVGATIAMLVPFIVVSVVSLFTPHPVPRSGTGGGLPLHEQRKDRKRKYHGRKVVEFHPQAG